MAVRPVKRYSVPRIPTRGQVDSQPEILQPLPKRWQGNQAVVSALAAATALTALSGCGGARVAPIFRHGDGRRAEFRGRVANPPVYLSEDEARQVIADEAKHAGITFRTPGPAIKGIEIPVTDRNGRPHPSETQAIKLETDGVDPVSGVAYEFVSVDDTMKWYEGSHGRLAAYYNNCLGAARAMRTALKGKGPAGVYAIFYEPAAETKRPAYTSGMSSAVYYAKAQKAQKEAERADREELRQQVRDFVKWLKAQGVI